MKLFSVIVLAFAGVSFCYAQEASQPVDSLSGLVVVKAKRERRREQPTDVRHTATSPDALNNTGIMPSGGGSTFPTFVYEYSAEIRNDSPKGVKWLSWLYVMTDPDTKQELDRQQFTSFDKIAAGQKKTAIGRKRIPPMQPGTGDPKKKKDGAPFAERVELVCVGYDDGSLWRPSFIPESHCREAEKRGKSR